MDSSMDSIDSQWISLNYYCYYYTPILATVRLGALQQRFYDRCPARPVMAPLPPCQGQPKTVQVWGAPPKS